MCRQRERRFRPVHSVPNDVPAMPQLLYFLYLFSRLPLTLTTILTLAQMGTAGPAAAAEDSLSYQWSAGGVRGLFSHSCGGAIVRTIRTLEAQVR